MPPHCRSFRLALIVALSATPVAGQGAQPGAARPLPRAQLARRIDSLTRATMARDRITGVSLAVIRGQDTILTTAGRVGPASRMPVTAHTVFAMASITKQFTASVIMQLVQREQLALDAPIERYVEGLPATWRAISLQQLLAQRSGIADYAGDDGAERVTLPARPTPRDLVAAVASAPLRFAPGSRYEYSNTNYVLLGLAIEAVTHKPWAAIIDGDVLRPAGLRDTWTCDAAPAGRLAMGSIAHGAALVAAPPLRVEAPYAAGALCGTALDVARFEHALAAGDIVPRERVAAMTTPSALPDGATPPYGLGVALDIVAGVPVFGHSGGIDGFSSDVLHAQGDNVTVAVLANTEHAPVQDLSRLVLRAALGLPMPHDLGTAKDLPLPAALRRRVSGEYRGGGGQIVVRVLDSAGVLTVQLGNDPPTRLLWQGDTRFRVASDPLVQVRFTPSGRVASDIQLTRDNERIVARRNGSE